MRRMGSFVRAAALFAAASLPPAARAEEAASVMPANLLQALGRAQGGQTIKLAAEDYGVVVFPRRTFEPPLVIDASAARFSGLVLANVSGVRITGGTVTGPGGRSYGVSIRNARAIEIAQMRITGAHRGVVVDRAQDVALVGNMLEGLISDGINIAYSYGVRVERNECRDFNPTPAVYDALGKRLRDGDHADCIQAWSRPQFPPTSDLTIINNTADGNMQGIFLGNHSRNGVGRRRLRSGCRERQQDPRIDAQWHLPHGSAQCEVVGNVVSTVPGARLPNRPERAVQAKLMVEGSQIRMCGNRVEGLPKNPGQEPCR